MSTLPKNLYLAEQVREMDRLAIEEYNIPGINLMKKAGQAVFELIEKHYSDRQLIIFCGAGNNAGDGYIIASLALKADYSVTVLALSNPQALKDDALTAYQDYIQLGGKTSSFLDSIMLNQCVVVDALFGTGLNRNISGIYANAISLINNSAYPVISVDIPSGLNADTGNLMGCAVKANHTVTFIALKQGMFTGFSAEVCGEIVFSSLGLNSHFFQHIEPSAALIANINIPKRHRCAHKGSNGHVLLIGGDAGFSGAIRLAAEAALRVGAGLVTVATRQSHYTLINTGRPEIMSHGIENSEALLPLVNKASIIVIGPGLGQSQWAKELFNTVLKTDKPIVVDADALNILSHQNKSRTNWVLTPHPGEAARLLKCSTTDIANNRFSAARQIQKKFKGICVLKGAGSIIDSGSETSISTSGNPGMASGGMGDVLAGIIGGLIAQKMALSTAAKSAVFLHGKAADLSAQKEGEMGMLASDLMPFIRKLVNNA